MANEIRVSVGVLIGDVRDALLEALRVREEKPGSLSLFTADVNAYLRHIQATLSEVGVDNTLREMRIRFCKLGCDDAIVNSALEAVNAVGEIYKPRVSSRPERQISCEEVKEYNAKQAKREQFERAFFEGLWREAELFDENEEVKENTTEKVGGEQAAPEFFQNDNIYVELFQALEQVGTEDNHIRNKLNPIFDRQPDLIPKKDLLYLFSALLSKYIGQSRVAVEEVSKKYFPSDYRREAVISGLIGQLEEKDPFKEENSLTSQKNALITKRIQTIFSGDSNTISQAELAGKLTLLLKDVEKDSFFFTFIDFNLLMVEAGLDMLQTIV